MTRKELNLAKLEDTLVELEQLVARLEEGALPLDKALKEFERGIQLTRQCQKVLKDTEQKIEICANCHPFFTGKQRFIDTAGRVEKFRQRYATKKEATA